MEQEINKLKQEYLKDTTPEFLKTMGLEDLWRRVDKKNHVPVFYNPSYVIMGVLSLIVLAGIFGIAAAEAVPGTPFYSARKFSQEAARKIFNVQLFNSAELQKTNPLQPSSATTTPTPIKYRPTPTKTLKLKRDDENRQEQEDVKGIETSKTSTIHSNLNSEKAKPENPSTTTQEQGNNKNKNQENSTESSRQNNNNENKQD